MQQTSELWDSIAVGTYTTEMRLLVEGHPIIDDDIISIQTSLHVFPDESPTTGNAVCGRINTEFYVPEFEIPRMAEIIPQARIAAGDRISEWLDQGHFYIDTRKMDHKEGLETLQIEGYDAMLKAEADCPAFNIDYPTTDRVMVQKIARSMGIQVDPDTLAIINHGYAVQLPDGYSKREVLSGIAAMYGGTFIISATGKLRLIRMVDIPKETSYLVTHKGEPITFGGDRILVD